MKSDLFDAKMRAFEKSNDEKLRPEMYVVCRIDGRNFSTLTRRTLKLEPYDTELATNMHTTVESIMNCGFPITFGYTQSDEISVLMDKNKLSVFDGKVRKYNSLLAAQASAIMSCSMSMPIVFDCRTIQLPTKQTVFDYFAWRRADSEKNCLNMLCFHILTTKKGLTPTNAQREMDRKPTDWKHDLLFEHDLNFDHVEEWKKRGIGFWWKEYEKDAINKKTGEEVKAIRKKLVSDVLPRTHEDFVKLLENFV